MNAAGLGPRRAPPRRPRPKRETRWQAVLDAAAAEFAARGYLGASTGQIARRLGLKQGSLYYYFPSKQRALELVCQLSTEEMLGGLGEIVGRAGEPRAKLRRAIEFHLDWLTGRPDYCLTFLRERKHVTGAAGRLLAETAHRYEALFERIFREGVAARVFRADCRPAQAAFATLAIINAFGLRAPRGRPAPRRSAAAELARWLADMMVAGFETRASPGRATSRPPRR